MAQNVMAMTGNSCGGFDEAVIARIDALARRHEEAGGLFMQMIGMVGSAAENVVDRLSPAWRDRVDRLGRTALESAYAVAFGSQGDETQPVNDPEGGKLIEGMPAVALRTDGRGIVARTVGKAMNRASGERWHRAAAGVSGAIGGLGGMATTLVDLPVTTTLILRSVQQVATGYGEDLTDPAVRAQCIAVFALGGPMADDDAQQSSLFAARIALSGAAIAEAIKAVLPKFGVMVSQKALAQATPLLGAVAGVAVNTLFTRHYQEMAHVHFGLRQIERDHDPEQVRACFERIVAGLRAERARTTSDAAMRRVGRSGAEPVTGADGG